MARGTRPQRVGEEILQELGVLLVREVHDPGIGFVTLTRTKVSPDLQLVRVYYTIIGDEQAKRETQRALERATPFLRRQIGARVQLRRVPELRFEFDASVEHQDRIERILLDLAEERKARGETLDGAESPAHAPDITLPAGHGPAADADVSGTPPGSNPDPDEDEEEESDGHS